MMPYYAYVLRLWPEIQGNTTVWRFALVDPQTGHRLGFETAAALVNHLVSKTQDGLNPGPTDSGLSSGNSSD